jgi:hypothetical protein
MCENVYILKKLDTNVAGAWTLQAYKATLSAR